MENSSSPYAPPKSHVEELEQAPFTPEPAGKWLRFFNLLIDYFGFTVLAMVVGIVIATIWGEQGIAALESYPDFIIGAFITMFYYTSLEALTGRTLGKLITGTRVVNMDGGRASVGQVFGRSLARLIPFEAFTFLGETGRGWHDSLARTYVIKSRQARR
jgi:uncharacterized RDD family membrane protein YckC